MTPTIQELFDRKSVRAFTNQPISAEDKQLILQAAAQAPTAGNQQMYTILDITDQKLKDLLAESCDHQPFIADAPLVLVFCADCRRWLKAYEEAGITPRKPGVGDLMLAVTDTAIAAQNVVTAAWSLGIGSCYIGDILEQYETHRRMLNLPEYVLPAVMAVFGYPTEQQLSREKPQRFQLDEVVCENTYQDPDGLKLRKMMAKNVGCLSYNEWITRFHDRKYNSDFAREMSRSVTEYLKQY